MMLTTLHGDSGMGTVRKEGEAGNQQVYCLQKAIPSETEAPIIRSGSCLLFFVAVSKTLITN